jgi:hypothetical protein
MKFIKKEKVKKRHIPKAGENLQKGSVPKNIVL